MGTRGPRRIVTAGFLLALVTLVGAALLSLTERAAREEISANEAAALETRLAAVLPDYDNRPGEDVLTVSAPDALGAPQSRIYRARRGGKIVAVAMTVVAPDGYAGPIRLLLGILEDGRISGVRVLSHRETPGLGDPIELERSDWILDFDGRSLTDPPPERWRVVRDGGDFDQFTGATITPRAVVAAIHRALEYFEANREQLLREAN